MHDSRINGDYDHSNEELNGKSSDGEENQLPTCGSKGDTENLNGKKKKNINEEEEIGIRKCRRKSPTYKYNEEVRVWTPPSKIQNVPLKQQKQKRRIV